MEQIFMNEEVLRYLLPQRAVDTHKGNYGKILMLCGSRGYTGAAALAAMGALRSGAGLVYLGVPECIYHIEAVKLTEPIVFGLPDENGMLCASALPEIMKLLPRMDVVLIGPGLGRSEGTLAVVSCILKEFKGPVIVDADGINVLSQHMDILRERQFPTVLTPHDMEFRRMGGKLGKDRIAAAQELAQEYSSVVVLKGHRTVVTDGETIYVNTTGNPGMAVGGSGDVLAGITAGILGQGVSVLYAAACAVWLHGAAGDLCAAEIGEYGMLPTDMILALPRLLK